MGLKDFEPKSYKALRELERTRGLEHIRVIAEGRQGGSSQVPDGAATYRTIPTGHVKQYVLERDASNESQRRIIEAASIAAVTWVGAIIGASLTAYLTIRLGVPPH